MAFHVKFLCYLIFCSAFVKYLFHILGRFRTWYNFCRTQICVGVICYFFAISLAMFCFILWSGLFECNILTKTFCFVVFAMVFVIFFARISGWFFLLQNQSVTAIYICLFWFFLVIFTPICICAFDRFITKPFATLTRQKLCLFPSLFGLLTRPTLVLFIYHEYALPNIVLHTYLYIFFCCFAFPRACKSYLSHPHI